MGSSRLSSNGDHLGMPGKLDHSTRAAALVTVLDPDGSAPFARQLARDRQAEAGTPDPTGGTAASEPLEDLLLLPGLQTGSVVQHLDPARLGDDAHLRAARRVSDRVLDHHVDRPVKIRRGAPAGPSLSGAPTGQFDPGVVGRLLPPLQRAIGRLRDVELLTRRLALAGAT